MKLQTTVAALFAITNSASAFAPATFVTRTSSALNVAIDTSDIKNGLTVEIDGDPHKVLDFSIMKQARGAAKMTIKFKNLTRGNTIENTYRSGEKFETAEVTKSPAQFTYEDESGNYYFMDMESFEEISVSAKVVEDRKKWIGEGSEVTLVTFKEQVIEVAVPKTLVVTVVETEPNVKGNTSQGHTKPAKLSCGATISVPGFISEGETIRVDSEKEVYLDRSV
mmetsp:Transcript_6165/g.8974  ORF Transcript_6165/g.8974 Transcript_6165/m.8974 type:complete len:223 (-) Transcript_6165:72-740(-)